MSATPAQRATLSMIAEHVATMGFGDSKAIGCRARCVRLVKLGYITEHPYRGPRGGTHWRYRLTDKGRNTTRRNTT